MSRISINNISYYLPGGTELFQDLNHTFNAKKNGLTGNNGAGKSTILNIISGVVKPHKGNVTAEGSISYLPQNIQKYASLKVGEVLFSKEKYNAYRKVLSGSFDHHDMDLLETEWDLESRAEMVLDRTGLGNIELERGFSSLSGGEKMRCLLAKMWKDKPDFILMDEPTNHLDKKSRAAVYDFVLSWRHGMIVVSHDRTLLKMMDNIVELSNLGLTSYGGNYDFYREQKNLEERAVEREFDDAEKEYKKNLRGADSALNAQQKRTVNAEKTKPKSGLLPGTIHWRQGRAERTAARLNQVHSERVEQSREKMHEAREKIKDNRKITIDVYSEALPKGKTIIELKDVNYKYDRKYLWKKNIDLLLRGNERLHLKGSSGSGKTTLINLIAGNLLPEHGRIKSINVETALLDQNTALLDDDHTLLDNMRTHSKYKLPEHELRIKLGRFLFYKNDVFKKAGVLSGGERMRAGLACLFAKPQPPALLILDEPANNLDINSIEELTAAVNDFTGALIVISHDQDLINDLNVERELDLDEYR